MKAQALVAGLRSRLAVLRISYTRWGWWKPEHCLSVLLGFLFCFQACLFLFKCSLLSWRLGHIPLYEGILTPFIRISVSETSVPVSYVGAV